MNVPYGGTQSNALAAYIILYAALYCSFGVSSPFWPKFFEQQGLTSQQIGLVLSLDMFTRLFAGPVVGRVADLSGSLRAVLVLCCVLAAFGAIALLSTYDFLMLLLLNVLLSAALAPTRRLPMPSRSRNQRALRAGQRSSMAG